MNEISGKIDGEDLDFDFDEFFKLFTKDMREYIKSIKESEALIKKGPVVCKNIDTSLGGSSVLAREVVVKNVSS